MTKMIFGHDDLAEVTFKLNKVPTGRFTIDSMALQNTVRPPVGEQAICVGGYWEGWQVTVKDGDASRFQIDLDAYKQWLKNLPNTIKWILLDIEANNGEFAYSQSPWDVDKNDPFPQERTARSFRLLHSIAREIRPEINLSLYCEGGVMPHEFFDNRGWVDLYAEPADSPLHQVYKDRINRLTYGLKGSTKGVGNPNISKVTSRGLTDCNEVIAGQYYLPLNEDMAIAERKVNWMGDQLRSVKATGQKIGCWVTPMGEGIDNTKGANWNKPLPLDLMAKHGAMFRRAGFDALILWGYQSDSSDGTKSEADRKIQQQQTWNEIWRPALETYAAAFI